MAVMGAGEAFLHQRLQSMIRWAQTSPEVKVHHEKKLGSSLRQLVFASGLGFCVLGNR